LEIKEGKIKGVQIVQICMSGGRTKGNFSILNRFLVLASAVFLRPPEAGKKNPEAEKFSNSFLKGRREFFLKN